MTRISDSGQWKVVPLNFSKRSEEAEIIDFPDRLSRDETVRVLRELGWINRWLGGQEACLRELREILESVVRKQGQKKPVRIADFGSGSADIPSALVGWARKKEYPIRLTAVDVNLLVCQVAQRRISQFPEITLVQGDVLSPPVRPGVFDIILCSALLHHLRDGEIVRTLQVLRSLTRKAVLVCDLHRHPLAYFGIRFLTALFSRSQAVRNDGPLSVLRGFRREEILAILHKAGIWDAEIKWRWAFRYVILIKEPRERSPSHHKRYDGD